MVYKDGDWVRLLSASIGEASQNDVMSLTKDGGGLDPKKAKAVKINSVISPTVVCVDSDADAIGLKLNVSA